MKRIVQFIATALLVTGAACQSDGSGGSANGNGGRGGGSTGAGSGGAPGQGGATTIHSNSGTGGGTNSGGEGGSKGGTGGSSGGSATTDGSIAGAGGSSSNGGTSGGGGKGGATTDAMGGVSGSTSPGDAAAGGKGGSTGKDAGVGTGGLSTSGGAAGSTSRTGSGGAGGLSTGASCTGCHGDAASNNPAPPSDTSGQTDTTAAGVGAHSKHMGASAWHRQSKCTDCHVVPTSAPHANGKVDFSWGAPSNASSAKPAFNATTLTCTGTYCHGTTLAGASTAKTQPIWNQVDETWNDCGTACHQTPPAASTGHPAASNCEACHSKVIASFKATSPATTWKDASLHINGTVEVDTLTCTTCHGSGNNPAPPNDTQGGTATTAAGVGAHAQHLATSTWHRQGKCADCHATPASNTHSNNVVDFAWGTPSNASSATPAFNNGDLSCSGTYCHGAKMADKSTSVGHLPVWTKVDGTHDACGKACHANPPAGGSHTSSSTACQNCHGDVIAAYNGATSTWKDATLHINGKVEAKAQSCSSCHGNPPSSSVHNRREHKVACTNCHPNSSGPTHQNGKVDQSCGSNNAGCHGND